MEAIACTHLEPERLLAAIRDRDQTALQLLVERYDAELVRVAYIATADLAAAEDAAQVTWMRLWAKPPTLRDPQSLRPWLLTVVSNEARHAARRQRRGTALIDAAAPRDLSSPGLGPELVDLRAAIARLDPDERRLIALRYMADLDFEAIGSILGLSAGGARTRLHRLQSKLRKDLNGA